MQKMLFVNLKDSINNHTHTLMYKAGQIITHKGNKYRCVKNKTINLDCNMCDITISNTCYRKCSGFVYFKRIK